MALRVLGQLLISDRLHPFVADSPQKQLFNGPLKEGKIREGIEIDRWPEAYSIEFFLRPLVKLTFFVFSFESHFVAKKALRASLQVFQKKKNNF